MKRILLVLPAMMMSGALATPSSAMPVAKSGVAESSAVEQIGYRKCGWHNGHKHCRYVDNSPSVSIELGGRHRHRHGNHYGHRDDHRGHGYGHNDSGVKLRVR
jgi:hypothetical protein